MDYAGCFMLEALFQKHKNIRRNLLKLTLNAATTFTLR